MSYQKVILMESDGERYLIPNELKQKFKELDNLIYLNKEEENDVFRQACEEFDSLFLDYLVQGIMPQLYIKTDQ